MPKTVGRMPWIVACCWWMLAGHACAQALPLLQPRGSATTLGPQPAPAEASPQPGAAQPGAAQPGAPALIPLNQPGTPAAPGASSTPSPSAAAPANAANKPTGPAAAPLYEHEPYDEIVLTQQFNNAVLKVEPLPFRRAPRNSRPTARLKLKLADEPEKLYELRWGDIKEIRFFEQLVLAKARELTAAGRRDEAYDYFQYLKRKDAKLPGLVEAVDEYFLAEYRYHEQRGTLDAALAVLRECHENNPRNAQLPELLGQLNQTLLERYAAKQNYAAARMLIRTLAEEYPDHPVAANWQSRLRKQTVDLMSKAQTAATQGRLREADAMSREAVLIWPEEPGAAELVAEIQKRYPRVIVGVRDMALSLDPAKRTDWAVRRSSRLLWRTFMELNGPGPEGGDYRCPFGQIGMDPMNRGFSIELRHGIRWSRGPATLVGADVSRRLLALATPDDPAFESRWDDLFGAVSVDDLYHVAVELRRPHVRCDALLQTILPCYAAVPRFGTAKIPNGPFVVDSKLRKKDTIVYVASPQYFINLPGQPKEVIERQLTDDRDAIRQLRDGRIHVLDRIHPWTLADYRSLENVRVERYGYPLLHCLICNTRRPMMAMQHFRRALDFGINREEILNKVVLAGPEPGCELLSGPFLRGDSYSDPIGYAYDTNIAPRPYDPTLAMMLAGVAYDLVQAEKEEAANGGKPAAPTKAKAKAAEEDDDTKPAPARAQTIIRLTLAHPPSETARKACESIKQYLKVIDVIVTLKELPPGPFRPPAKDVDLVYAELPLWEPIVDGPWLLGPNGPAGKASPHVIHVLSQLSQATDWREARPLLYQLHRIAHDEVTIIPLWQLTEHYAYNDRIGGLGERPVGLYQNVEKWRLAAPRPKEKP